MHLERYEFEIKENRYIFFSQGPKGMIEKAVLYDKLSGQLPLYALSFGDWKEKESRIDDRVVTNNGDTKKILATVAATAVNFSMQNPDTCMFAVGSTPSRTRLYQMNIALNLTIIRPLYEVEGFIDNNWQPFQTGSNYIAFLLKPRKLLSL